MNNVGPNLDEYVQNVEKKNIDEFAGDFLDKLKERSQDRKIEKEEVAKIFEKGEVDLLWEEMLKFDGDKDQCLSLLEITAFVDDLRKKKKLIDFRDWRFNLAVIFLGFGIVFMLGTLYSVIVNGVNPIYLIAAFGHLSCAIPAMYMVNDEMKERLANHNLLRNLVLRQ